MAGEQSLWKKNASSPIVGPWTVPSPGKLAYYMQSEKEQMGQTFLFLNIFSWSPALRGEKCLQVASDLELVYTGQRGGWAPQIAKKGRVNRGEANNLRFVDTSEKRSLMFNTHPC